MTEWCLENIDIGVMIPWCYHGDRMGRIIRIEYSGIHHSYRVTCSCEKVYPLTVTGKYVEAK